MLFGFLVTLYVIVCLFLCLLVLIQSDKGGGLSGALGGGMSNASALLGTQDTANILTKATSVSATLFMVLCIVISLVVSRGVVNQGSRSALQERAEKVGQYAPASILQQGLILDGEEGGGDAGMLLPLEPLEDEASDE